MFMLEYTTPVVKHRSGCIILWGCFSAGGSGALYKINCIMEKASNVDILKQDLKTSAWMLKAWAQMFPVNNDKPRCHSYTDVSKRIKNNMSRSGVELTMTLNVHAETPPVVMTVWQRG